MPRESGNGTAAPWRSIVQAFIDAVAEMIRAGPPAALDRAMEKQLIDACAQHNATVDEFVAALEDEGELREELQQAMSLLLSQPAAAEARRQARRRELERHLHLLRYVMAGTEPPEWVWEPIDERERARIRDAREADRPDETDVVTRIDRALSKAREQPELLGSCEECGKEIAAQRLDLVPYAERCMDCQRQRESKPEPPSPLRVPVLRF